MIGSKMIRFLIFTFFFFFNYSFADNPSYIINVQDLEAYPDDGDDCKQALLDAWANACDNSSAVTIYVPHGRHALSKTVFDGTSCGNNEITIEIDGTLILSSSEYNDNWLVFQKVAGLTINGGTLDGQGKDLWDCKNSGKGCHQGATSLAVYNSHDVTINRLTSLNSQMFHILIDGCENVNLYGTKITAPEDSPNTDGIHIALSSHVTIMNSIIGTGDDCLSIGPGSTNLWIEETSCGPGHGISIGSLGKADQEEGVQNVTVKTATLTGTMNGVRIKTFAKSSNAFVSDVTFQHITIVDVFNPVLIDQHYCPDINNCPHQVSGVEISNVRYDDVQGSSASPFAVKLDCSKDKPCSKIQLKDVKLTYHGHSAKASCSNVNPEISGDVWQSC